MPHALISLLRLQAIAHDHMHGVGKLVFGDEAIAATVCLLQQLRPDLGVHPGAAIGAEDVIEVLDANFAVIVIVKDHERFLDLLDIVQSLAIYAG